MTTTHVYRCYDQGGTCLYVGATRNLEQRLVTHELNSPWGSSSAAVEVTDHEDWHQAHQVEFDEIARLRPRWNIQGRGHRSTWQLSDYAEVILSVHARRGLGMAPPYYDAHNADRKIERLLNEVARRFGRVGRLMAADLAACVPPVAEQVSA